MTDIIAPTNLSQRLVRLASRQRLLPLVLFELELPARMPAIYQWAEQAKEGGFAAYEPRLSRLPEIGA